ncbi:nucleotide exchange factor GrpE [Blattabacterium sp. (Blaberus giganteus)]|uniref:nucleotide exchange factor GrpE n=1 Tax=Blattabacterium sp. (Blaberus giganteus) TaxID=1186051 RepID=UPI00025F6E48|nr:nucleotide exchange factor GrpE [Blattabacterium sp. (Blaberus giganteus)]AFJ90535.1 chaperone GrpE [Blattabacterium sp. (Blaberus giganteus)]
MDINQKNIGKQSKSDIISDSDGVSSSCSCQEEKHNPLKKEKEIQFINIKEELKKEKDKFLRLFAEFDNYKKRIQKERFDIFRNIHEQILIDLIPILDDFERGIRELKKHKDELLVKGVFLIQEKLIKILKKKGLNKIKIKKGDDFNTDFHEAITQIPAITENLKGKIIEIIEAGYILKEKVIRHAKVIIGK